MNWLLCCSLVQGTVLSIHTKLSLSILSCSDKGLVLVISLITLVLRAFAGPLRVGLVSPFSELKLRTSLLSHAPVLLTPLHCTEVSILQGGGLGKFVRLLSAVSVGTQVLPKLFMLMAAVWLLG